MLVFSGDGFLVILLHEIMQTIGHELLILRPSQWRSLDPFLDHPNFTNMSQFEADLIFMLDVLRCISSGKVCAIIALLLLLCSALTGALF